MMEENLRRAMLLSRGDPTTFVTSPLSLGLLLAALPLLGVATLPAIKSKPQETFQEAD
jgi:TctA family transporter